MKYPISNPKLNLLISASVLSILAGCGGGGGGGSSYSGGSSGATATTTTTTTVSSTPTTTNPVPSGQIIYPASVPQPTAGTDIVGVNLQNTTSSALAAHAFTFGQIFKQSVVHSTDTLVAHIAGVSTAAQVQLDTLATWPDGSVKLGAITLITPALSAGSTVGVLLSKKTASDPTFSTTPVDLVSASASTTLNVSLTFTSGQYSGPRSIDLAAALHTALLAGSPSYWLQGSLATQARVDVPLAGGALHITADVTAYADGSVTADVQFNNDIVTPAPTLTNVGAPLPPQIYTTTVNLGSLSSNYSITQYQYQDWHAVLNSVGAPQLNVSSSTAPAINVQHDLAYLEYSGAILSYDRTTGVSDNTLQGFSTIIAGTSTYPAPIGIFGRPLASNGVTSYMPQTGGRADIGYTTMYNTAWLMTGDSRAATVGLAQGDTAGAVDWNYKLANGNWLTPADYPAVWATSDQGVSCAPGCLQNGAPSLAGWTPDAAHQPNLSYVPYIMTGQRWFLDRLNAQAAFILATENARLWDQYYYPGDPNDIVLGPTEQIRGAAWNMREIQEAAWLGKPGSFEQGYFTQVVTDNWNTIAARMPALNLSQGEAAGWLPGYGTAAFANAAANTPLGEMSTWMQDYFTGIAVLGTRMGYSGAKTFLDWQKDGWLTGRFIAPTMNPYDGTAYRLIVTSSTGANYTTWAGIEAATVANGFSNGSSFSFGNSYAQWARGALGAALTVYPGDSNLTRALNFVQQHGTYVDPASLQSDPTFNVVPLQ